MDELSTVLESVRLRGQMYCRLEARAPWAMSAPLAPAATFHGVASGDAVLRIPGERELRLKQGDLAVLCHGAGHVIGDAPERTPLPFHDVMRSAGGSWLVRCGGRGARTVIVCGGFAVERDGPPLLALMPAVIHLRGNQRVGSLLSLLAAEGAARSAGGDAFVGRLTEALFVEVARDLVARGDPQERMSFSALSDKRIAATLASIHRRPSHGWTVEALARAVGMSRSAFAQAFAQIVGATPLAYIAHHRLYTAKVLLRESPLGVAQIANRVGYESEASLSKSFRRHFGLPPGAYRRSLGPSSAASRRPS